MLPSYARLYAEVRRAYTPEKARAEARAEFPAYVLFRPLSFAVTPLFILLGFGANGVTVLGMLGAAAVPAVAGFGGTHAYLWVGAMLFGLQVLDCVDGNIARFNRRPTLLGAMLDGIGTQLAWTGYFVALGYLARGQAGVAGDGVAGWAAVHGVEIGAATALVFLLQRDASATFSRYFSRSVDLAPPVPAEARNRGFGFVDLVKNLEQPVAIAGVVVAGAVGGLPWFLLGLATYQATAVGLWLPRYARSIREQAKLDDPRDGC